MMKQNLLLMFTVIVLSAQAQDSVIKRTVEFNFGGYTFTDELIFYLSDYNYYKALSKIQLYSNYATELGSHPYLVQLAKILDEDAKDLGYTGFRLAEYLVAFVQEAIPYKADPYNNGYDYPRYPIETIVEQGGDCEDKAALLVALLNTFGFDAILVNTPGHMAAALACSNCNGYYNYNGKRYSFIETTEKGWQIGSIPANESGSAKLLDVPRPPQYRRSQEATVSIPPKDKGNGSGAFNIGNRDYGNSSNTTSTSIVIINGVTYQIKGNGSTTIKVNGATVSITNN